MSDRSKGDPCPECGTALDIRFDDPVAERRTILALGFIIGTLILMPIIGSLAVLLGIIASYQSQRHHTLIDLYRPSYRTRKRRRLIRTLIYAWVLEIFAMLAISQYWPGALNWW
jgi:hypothetical protein